MGTHLYVQAMIGIEIKLSNYQVQETGKNFWCTHLEPGDSNVNHCPDCGKKRPENPTRTYMVTEWERFPKPFLDALAGQGTSLEDFDLNELAWSNCSFEGGITLFESGEKYWLGKSLGELGGYDADETIELDINELSADIKGHIAALGFNGEKTKFIMHSYWA